jgi:hypothetical protein
MHITDGRLHVFLRQRTKLRPSLPGRRDGDETSEPQAMEVNRDGRQSLTYL